ncbi:hypothetical protein SprV_0401448500 [Sparganum proliferum]
MGPKAPPSRGETANVVNRFQCGYCLPKKEKPPVKAKIEVKAPVEPKRKVWTPSPGIWHLHDPDFSEEAAGSHPATTYGFRFGLYMRMDRQERVHLYSYPRNGNYSLL